MRRRPAACAWRVARSHTEHAFRACAVGGFQDDKTLELCEGIMPTYEAMGTDDGKGRLAVFAVQTKFDEVSHGSFGRLRLALDLRGNKLQSLPESFREIKAGGSLSLGGDELDPKSLRPLRKVTRSALFQSPPWEVANRSSPRKKMDAVPLSLL